MEAVKIERDAPLSLLERIQLGDANAESELVEKYYKPLLFILRQQTQDIQLAQDLCQDAFAVTLSKARIGQIKSANALGGYIRSVGVNMLVEYKRKAVRQKTDLVDDFSFLNTLTGSEVEVQITREKILETISQIVQEMPNERDQKILKLAFVDGNEKSEICDELDLSPAHYDRVLYRAKHRLRQHLSLKLNIDDSKFKLIDIVCVAIAFGFLSSASQMQVGENTSSYHFINKVNNAVQHEKVK